MDNNSTFNHLKNILLLPVSGTLIIPFLLYRYIWDEKLANDHLLLLIIGGAFILVGAVLLFYTIFLFKTKGKGTLAPWNPTKNLVINGPYKYMRNPMIAGVLCILLGEALFINSIIILVWAMLFFIVSTLYFQFIEESKLERQFGNSYSDYKDNVPRWIPKREPYTEELL